MSNRGFRKTYRKYTSDRETDPYDRKEKKEQDIQFIYDEIEQKGGEKEIDTQKLMDEYLEKGGKITDCTNIDKKSMIDKAYQLLSSCRSRANTKGLEYDLDIDWVLKKIDNGKCEATGLKFDYNSKRSFMNPLSPSIDRINSAKGYTKDNCWIVVWNFNRAKADLAIETVIELAEAIIENKDKILKVGELCA